MVAPIDTTPMEGPSPGGTGSLLVPQGSSIATCAASSRRGQVITIDFAGVTKCKNLDHMFFLISAIRVGNRAANDQRPEPAFAGDASPSAWRSDTIAAITVQICCSEKVPPHAGIKCPARFRPK